MRREVLSYFCPETKVPKVLRSKGEMARLRLNYRKILLALTTNGVKAQNISSPIISISTSADFPSYAVVAYLLSFGVVQKAFSVGRNNFGAENIVMHTASKF